MTNDLILIIIMTNPRTTETPFVFQSVIYILQIVISEVHVFFSMYLLS